jgi:hypothetical protein
MADTFAMTVVYTNDNLEVSIGTKAINIPLATIDSWSSEEQSLVYSLMNNPSPHEQELTLEDLQALRDLYDRLLNKTFEQAVEVTVQKTAAEAEFRTRATGLDYAELRINQLEATFQAGVDGYVLFIYDIPQKKNKECPNPSCLLWHHGFRLNKSCWVLPINEKGIRHKRVKNLMARWNVHLIEQHVIRFHEEDNKKIREIAYAKLIEELGRIERSLNNAIIQADKKLQELLEDESVESEKAEVLRDNKVRTKIRKSCEALEAATKCAELFDNFGRSKDLIAAKRLAVAAHAEIFNIDAKEKGIKEAPMPEGLEEIKV